VTAGNGETRDVHVDRSLEALVGAAGDAAAPMSDALARELERMKPARPRAPARQLGGIVALSLLYAGGLVAAIGVRRDLAQLPIGWVIGFAALWLVSFASITWLVVVPPRGHVMPRWRSAATLAATAAVLLIAGGLLVPREVPGVSTMYEPSMWSVLEHAGACVAFGMTGVIVPVALAAIAVRGSVPVGSRWAAAAIGAAGGALGGLVLHMHCPIAERFHVGLVHGGVVVLAALVAALMAGLSRK
jgi:hypothetical protein